MSDLQLKEDLEQEIRDLVTEEVVARLDEICEKLNFTEGSEARHQLRKAFLFAARAHAGQTRVSGEAYITHPLEVMAILTELNVDLVTLIGALLHDVIEDTGVTIEDVAREFGPVAGLLVEGMTKLAALRYDSKSNEDRQAEYFRKMLLSMAQDLRVILIKLADRLHNMRTLDALPPKTRRRIAHETIEIYAPLAHRFGIGRVKMELEDLALKVTDEVAYRRIAERVSMKRDEREQALNQIMEPLTARLEKEGIKANLSGRAKHFFSIYNKIKKRGKSFEEILDLLAVRVIVPTVSDCYRTLGIVHSLYTPILERFSDYIAMPKANMYQSLHTKVMDRQGRVVEVQIRTYEMDLVAEVGIAAHWQYKEGSGERDPKDELTEYYRWLRQLIEGSKEDASGEEFMETLKINLFTDEVFVFTPRGKLIQLPKGSTPIDFAFAVHTDIGLRTLGAKVNGRMVPLDYQLKNGDSVEVLTSGNTHPRVEWLRIVKTHRARSKIKKFFKIAHLEDSIRIGEEMLKHELQKHRRKLAGNELSDLAISYGHESIEGFYAAIGGGDLSVHTIVNRLVGAQQELGGGEQGEATHTKLRFLRGPHKEPVGVRVKGLENLMISFGNCCNPLPGDRIVGYISKGRGITVHRIDCSNVSELSKDPDRIVEVDWDVSPEERYNARIRLVTEDRQHMLRDLAEVLSKQDITIVEMNLNTEGSLGIATLVIRVKNLAHLSKLRARLNRVRGVVQVERIGVADVAEKVV